MESKKEPQLRILVCGGRNYTDREWLGRELDHLQPTLIIHGAAAGADSLAAQYARQNNIPEQAHPAQWQDIQPGDRVGRNARGTYSKDAGHRRNARMLAQQPDLVVAFPGGPGTRDMVRRARAAGLEVLEIVQ